MFSTIPPSVTESNKSNLIFNLFSPPLTKIWQNSPQVYLFNLFYEFIFHPNRHLDRQPPVVRKPVQEIVLVFLSFSLSVAFQWDSKINICRFGLFRYVTDVRRRGYNWKKVSLGGILVAPLFFICEVKWIKGGKYIMKRFKWFNGLNGLDTEWKGFN